MKHEIYRPVRHRDANYFLRDIRASQSWATPKFLSWLEDHMHIWDAFCETVDEAKGKGYASFSARAAIHIMRFRMSKSLRGNYKVANNMTPYLARLYNHMYCPAESNGFLTTAALSR